jgi:hypothetical protein
VLSTPEEGVGVCYGAALGAPGAVMLRRSVARRLTNGRRVLCLAAYWAKPSDKYPIYKVVAVNMDQPRKHPRPFEDALARLAKKGDVDGCRALVAREVPPGCDDAASW